MRHVDQAVALESAVLKVAAAREFAYLQRQKLEERLDGLVAVLPTMAFYKIPYESDAELGRMAPADISRGNPLGRDRHGNEYWLLFAQRRMSLVAQGLAVTFLNGPQGATYNPQVFLREPTGVWSVHCGQNIPDLIAEFSTSILCEHYLRENMIEGLHYTKKSLLSRHLVFKPMQLEWVERQARAESYLRDTANMLAGLDVISTVKKLETLWAKFMEVRCFVHNGYTFRNEPDTVLNKLQGHDRHEKDAFQRRLKKMRDTYQEEIVEHHPVKGWYRFDPMGHLRELWCATSADRMHADPMVCQQMILTAKRSKFLSALIPYLPPPVPVGATNPPPVSVSDPSILIELKSLEGLSHAQNTMNAEVPLTAISALQADTISLPSSLSASTIPTALAPLDLLIPIVPVISPHASVTAGSSSTHDALIKSSSQMQSVDPLISGLAATKSNTVPADVTMQIEHKNAHTVINERGQETVIEDILEAEVEAGVASSSSLVKGQEQEQEQGEEHGQGQGHGQLLEHECKMSSLLDSISDSMEHALDATTKDTSHDTVPMDTGGSDIQMGDDVMNGITDSRIVTTTVGGGVVAPPCDEDEMGVDVLQDTGQTRASPPVVSSNPVRIDDPTALGSANARPLIGEEDNDVDGIGEDEMDVVDEVEGDEEGGWTPPSTSQGSPRQGPAGNPTSSGSHSGINSARVKVRNSLSNKVKTDFKK